MSAIVPFDYHGRRVRTAVLGVVWFVAADVRRVLGLRDATSAIRHLDEDEKGPHIVRTPGGDQELSIISESGLYALILRSRKPEARAFRKWVTAEVLPAIRRHGFYALPDRGSQHR